MYYIPYFVLVKHSVCHTQLYIIYIISTDVFVFADKTSNIYKMTPQEHKTLLKENVTKTYTYRKAPPNVETAINLEAKCIATNLNLSDKIERLAQAPAYITLKDHKENFRSNLSCRLINSSKTELGRISKIILDRINNEFTTSGKALIML